MFKSAAEIGGDQQNYFSTIYFILHFCYIDQADATAGKPTHGWIQFRIRPFPMRVDLPRKFYKER